MAMTGAGKLMSQRLLAVFLLLLAVLPTAENIAIGHDDRNRGVVQPSSSSSSTSVSPGSFYRGAVEAPPPTSSSSPHFRRDSVEYRPTPDYAPVGVKPRFGHTKLQIFSQPIFLSQFFIPSLQVDYIRQTYPDYYHLLPVAAHPPAIYNTITKQLSGTGEPCVGGQAFRALANDCSGYQICLYDVWTNQYCADGLHWNAQSGICDWPQNVGCTVSTDESPAQTTTTTPSPTTTTVPVAPPAAIKPPPPSSSASGSKKVICYYTNWSWYRVGDGKYGPSDVDVNLCTHVLYGFATLDPTLLTMRVFDSWSDTDEYGPKLYAKVTALKASGIKVLIALGGWNDSLGNKYSRLVNDPSARKRFIDNAIIFIEQYGFDGLDLDWEYPKCWQVDCDAGPASDKAGFSAWVSELRAAFNPRGWLLSAAVSPSKTVIDAAYDIPSISRDLDWIGVMTYDYHGHWDKKTGHVAPLYDHSEADVAYFNTNYTLNYYIRLGADPSKIIMGLPLYGQSFTLVNPSNTGLNSPSSGVGEAGAFTRQGGFLAYYEICKQIQSGGWTVVQDTEGAMGPYAYKGNQWVSFDDADMIRKKSELVKTMNIGGAMIWALDLDDFRNSCGCETYPLLKTINRVLRNYPGRSSCQAQFAAFSNDDYESLKGIDVWAPNLSRDMKCVSGSFLADESDCSGFYYCDNGYWKSSNCPSGLYWNDNESQCDWSFKANCARSI